MRFSKIILELILLYAVGIAQEIHWITGVGSAAAVNITVDEARKLAIERARVNALQQLELDVESRIQYLKAENGKQLLSSFIQLNRTAVRGRIVQEDTLDWKKYFTGDIPVYEVKLRVKAISELGRPDPEFVLQLNLNQTSFRSGEEMIITVRSTRDCYLYLFNLIQGDSIIRIFPNSFFKNNFLPADSVFVFPPPDLQKLFALEIRNESQKAGDEELILAVATRRKIPFSLNKTLKSESSQYVPTLKSELLDLNKWLLNFKLDEFTETVKSFRVLKNKNN